MLEGTLDSFTLPDIFQLLAFTKKTGCLNLDTDDQHGRVYFKGGEVYFASSSTRRMALGRRLVGAGLVTTEQLQAGLDAQDDGVGLRLGQILVDQAALEEETLETFVREQIQDAVFDLMRWQEGEFRFDVGVEPEKGESIQLSVSVENLIMEGSRRLEEWSTVNKKIPSMHALVAMAPLPGDSGVEVNLQPEEWRLLTMVDGRRTVRDIVDLHGQGEFATCRLLYGLVGAGLLEVRDPELEGPPSIAELLTQQELIRQLEDEADPQDAPEPEPEAEPEAAAPDEQPPLDVDVDIDAIAEAVDEPESKVTDATPPPLKATPSTPSKGGSGGGSGGKKDKAEGGERRLTTDPAIDADLVQRLIAGVKGL